MSRAVDIQQARKLGEKNDLRALAVISVLPDGRFGITTWGKTRRECGDMKQIGDKINELILGEIIEFPVDW